MRCLERERQAHGKQIQYFREWIELGSPGQAKKFRIRSRLQNAKRSKQMRESSSKIREDSPMTGLTEDTNRKTYGPFNLFKNLKSLHPSRIPSIILSKKVRRNPNKSCPNCRLSFTGQKSIPRSSRSAPTPYQIYRVPVVMG